MADSKKPIESCLQQLLPEPSLSGLAVSSFWTTRRGPEEASFFPKGLVFGLWNDVGLAGEVLTNKHPRPAAGLLGAASSQANLCQNQGTRLGHLLRLQRQSVSDARLGRSKASHINPGFDLQTAVQLRGLHSPNARLDHCPGHMQGRTREMRPSCRPALCFPWLHTARHSAMARACTCVLRYPCPK